MLACAAALAGCTAKLGDLQGPRSATVVLAGTEGPVQELPVTFALRNGSWAPILVESARVPISTVIATEPALPATIKPGGVLSVTVTSKLRPDGPLKERTILLETKGVEPLRLTVQPERAR